MANLAKTPAPALQAYSLAAPEKLADLATLAKDHIKKHNLCTNIQGRDYVNVEGWQFLGAMLGIMPRVDTVEDVSSHEAFTYTNFKEKKEYTIPTLTFRAKVSLIDMKTQNVVGAAVASCSNVEAKKRTFDPYAVESMAQTRAVGKAYRLMLGWIMSVAGYATTPLEEMPDPEPETSAVVVEPSLSAVISLMAEATKAMEAARSLAELRDIWSALPKAAADQLQSVKDTAKARIEAAIQQAAETKVTA